MRTTKGNRGLEVQTKRFPSVYVAQTAPTGYWLTCVLMFVATLIAATSLEMQGTGGRTPVTFSNSCPTQAMERSNLQILVCNALDGLSRDMS